MSSLTEEFVEFWHHYPRRIGRLAAFKAYAKARKLASAELILDGVKRYCQHLPEDLQFVCHATTFLNQGRWDDDYEVSRPVTVSVFWGDECNELHGGACLKQWDHCIRMREERAS
jgi:hypothetical protein